MSLLSPQLEAFVAIVNAKTVQSASKTLNLTQTGVTQRIRALESQLNCSLFIRSRRGMQLTDEGQALLRYCQNAQELEGEAFAKIKKAGKDSKIRISILGPTSIMRSRIIPACIPIMKKFKNLLMTYEISDTKSGDEALRLGEVQFAILPPEKVAKEMDSKILKPEQYVLVGHRDWKRRSLKDILENERIIDFADSDPMTHNYLKRFKLLSQANPDRHFVNNNESLLEMLNMGLGYGVLTKEFAEKYHNQLCILNSGQFLENKLALAWYPRPQMPEYFKAFVSGLH